MPYVAPLELGGRGSPDTRLLPIAGRSLLPPRRVVPSGRARGARGVLELTRYSLAEARELVATNIVLFHAPVQRRAV
jgi:hypothetical protein